jgi:hypothetical protein
LWSITEAGPPNTGSTTLVSALMDRSTLTLITLRHTHPSLIARTFPILRGVAPNSGPLGQKSVWAPGGPGQREAGQSVAGQPGTLCYCLNDRSHNDTVALIASAHVFLHNRGDRQIHTHTESSHVYVFYPSCHSMLYEILQWFPV